MLNSDIYIMIPVGGTINNGILHNNAKSEIIDGYLNELNETSRYECDNKVSMALHRTNYGSASISYYDDDNSDA